LNYGLRHSQESDPEQYYWSLQALKAQILAQQKQEKKAKSLLAEIERNLNKLPLPRKIETLIYSSQACVFLGNNAAASSLAKFSYKRSVELGMWGWAIEALGILARHSDKKEQYQKQLKTLLTKLSSPLPKNIAKMLHKRF
jgi:ATP/maltotriose-dependent transcriptional regulator MalT